MTGRAAVAGVALLLLAIGSSWPAAAPHAAAHPQGGSTPAAIPLTDLDGAAARLAWPAPTPILLDFMDVDCRPCQAQMGTLRSWYASTSPRVALVSVEVWSGPGPQATASLPALRHFHDEHNMTWPLLLDTRSAAMARYGVDAVPTLVLVDPVGRASARHEGLSGEASILQAAARLADAGAPSPRAG